MMYVLFVKYYNLVFGENSRGITETTRYIIVEDNNQQNNTQFLKKYKEKYPNASIKIYECEITKHKPTKKTIDDISRIYGSHIRSAKLQELSKLIC